MLDDSVLLRNKKKLEEKNHAHMSLHITPTVHTLLLLYLYFLMLTRTKSVNS